jgi:hypothetical protein
MKQTSNLTLAAKEIASEQSNQSSAAGYKASAAGYKSVASVARPTANARVSIGHVGNRGILAKAARAATFSQAVSQQQYNAMKSNGEGGALKLDKIKLIIAVYHVLFCNEAAIQNVYGLVDSIKHSEFYKQRVKSQTNDIEKQLDLYRAKVNMTFVVDRDGRNPGNLVMFANMNDYMDTITLPVINNTRLAIRLALSQAADNAVADGQMKSDNFDEDILSRVVLAVDLCHIATEVFKAELCRASNLCGGVIERIQPYNLEKIEGAAKMLCRQICHEMRVDGIKISEDPSIHAWIKDLCKKICSVQNIINAIKIDENDAGEAGNADESGDAGEESESGEAAAE